MPSSRIPDLLLISQAAAAAFAGARLLHFRMWRRFSCLTSYLLIIALRASVLSVFAKSSKPYLWGFLILEPVTWLAAALSVHEMFALVFRDYPGLRTAGRWALHVAISVSAGASLLPAHAPWPNESLNTRRLYYELTFDRSIHFSLAVIIVVLLLFLSRYPLHLDRNTYVASGFFSAMFLAQALVRLIDTLTPRLFAHYADYPEVSFTALCFLGWGLMLRPATAPKPAMAPANKLKEAELLQQLESLNQILTRSVQG